MTGQTATATAIKDWFSIQEACAYLTISEPTLFRWMKAGKISYFKVGNSTRFKKENLDMVAEKKVSDAEGAISTYKCAVCGNTGLVPGRIRSTGKIYFQPGKSKFFTLREALVNMEAMACTVCGHIQLRADTESLGKIIPEEK
jgi:excisionase family DNA binding protein